MKRISLFATAFLLSILLVGCGGSKEKKVEDNGTGVGTENETIEESNGSTESEDIDINNDSGDVENNLEVADDAADKVTSLENVESATVLVTDNNAYVAAVLKETTGGEGTDELEMQIADEVKTTNSNIQNVYVSVNPDFAQRFTEYGDKIRAGEPVEGFFEEFTEAVKNVFPDAK